MVLGGCNAGNTAMYTVSEICFVIMFVAFYPDRIVPKIYSCNRLAYRPIGKEPIVPLF